MHPRIVLAIARKDAIDILVNRSTNVILLLPVLVSLLYLLIRSLVSSLGSHPAAILVYNPGQSRVAQVIGAAFADTRVTRAGAATEVSAAFGASGSRHSSSYAVGLIVPTHFETEVRAGSRPQLTLYINGDDVDTPTAGTLQAAINNYARVLVDPRAPATVGTVMINPPAPTGSLDAGKIFISLSLLISFCVGLSIIPQLLIEEKEKKTLRMLLVTPASFTDVVGGKVLVVLIYQVAVCAMVLATQGAFTGNVLLVLLFALLGSCFSVALGLLFGSIFQTAAAAGAVGGIIIPFTILPGIVVGPVEQQLGSSPIVQASRLAPTYYIADGWYHASQNQGTWGTALLDIGVIAGYTLLLLALAVCLLRRQALVAAAI